MKILSIDLSCYGSVSVCCLFDTEAEKPTFKRVVTTAEALRRHAEDVRPDHVVFECCGVAHVIRRALWDGPWSVTVASVNEEQWKWRTVKRKTDRDDALKVAKLFLAGDIVPVHMPAERVRQWRALITYREAVEQWRALTRTADPGLL